MTVTSLEPAPWPDIAPPPGVEVHPTRLGELMPVAARGPQEKAYELARIARVEGQLAAYKVEIAAGAHPHGAGRCRGGRPAAA